MWRNFYSWTLDELAGRSGVERGTIGAMEMRDSKRSEHGPSLAKAFGIAYEQLLDDNFAPFNALEEAVHIAVPAPTARPKVSVDPQPPQTNEAKSSALAAVLARELDTITDIDDRLMAFTMCVREIYRFKDLHGYSDPEQLAEMQEQLKKVKSELPPTSK